MNSTSQNTASVVLTQKTFCREATSFWNTKRKAMSNAGLPSVRLGWDAS